MIDIQSDSVLKKISFKYLANLIKIATIQPKNLTKIIKIFTIVIVFQQQKKKKKKLFYHQITKKSYVIEEAKAKFFTTTVNWYKYQLTVVCC